MATYKVRGNAHNVIYPYKTPDGAKKQQWETYETELEAVQRKAYIDYLQKSRNADEIYRVAMEYKEKRAAEQAAIEAAKAPLDIPEPVILSGEDNTDKTYGEFVEKWLPIHARKKRFSPDSYDSYRSNLDNHILPYFGKRIMSTITSEDIDNFLDYLSQKPCKGTKSYGKNPTEIPTLSSGSVKKCYTILTSGFPSAKKWKYITEIPDTSAPAEKNKKRKAWAPEKVYSVMESIDDKLLHLAVHLSFVCSLRAGETAGIEANTIDFHDRSLWIKHQIQRVSDKALSVIPSNEIIFVFPKQKSDAKSSLILKGPKTEGSYRKYYLTTPLLKEIKERLEQIGQNKEFFGEEYHDYGLLICQPDGRPFDPKSFDKKFKEYQNAAHIENGDQIEFQGLRKSGQMHKVRITKNNYQLVAESAGQPPEVLMSNYNEALDSEKRTLSLMVETSFYPQTQKPQVSSEVATVLETIQNNPELTQQILQALLSGAVHAQ